MSKIIQHIFVDGQDYGPLSPKKERQEETLAVFRNRMGNHRHIEIRDVTVEEDKLHTRESVLKIAVLTGLAGAEPFDFSIAEAYWSNEEEAEAGELLLEKFQNAWLNRYGAMPMFRTEDVSEHKITMVTALLRRQYSRAIVTHERIMNLIQLAAVFDDMNLEAFDYLPSEEELTDAITHYEAHGYD